MALWQVVTGGAAGKLPLAAGRGPEQLLAASVTIDSLLGGDPDALAAALGGPAAGPVPPGSSVVVPIGGQEVWAAGVTYTRSLDARMLESGTPDIYQRVYQAERPELLLKAAPGRVRGRESRWASVRIRSGTYRSRNWPSSPTGAAASWAT